jgi:hypothetical protein
MHDDERERYQELIAESRPMIPDPTVPPCRRCGPGEPRLSRQRFANGAVHLRASCSRCDAFLGYVARGRLTVMPFGKYAGRKFEDVPDAYLAWLVRTPGLRANVVRAAAAELDRRQAAAEADEHQRWLNSEVIP